MQHEPALDGIRGAAVGAVLLFHAGHVRGGYLGVDLFFTLSGFLITSLLIAEIGSTRGVRLGAFWGRRARRLLPALVILLIGVALYALFVAQSNELDQIRWDGVWTLLYVANWRQVFGHIDYWSMFAAPSPLQHTWSLAIEEQFYLVWPLVMFAIARKARDVARATTYVAASIAVAGSVWLVASYNPADPSRSYYGTDTRIASIAFGALLAGLLARKGRRELSRGVGIAVQAIGWAGVVVIFLMWKTLDGTSDYLYRGGFTLAAISAACVIAAVITRRDGALARMLSFRPLCALGLISYGVYLYHWPIFVYLDAARTGLDGWTLTAVRVLITLIVATLSYYLVERPIRYHRFDSRRLVLAIPVVAAVATVALVASTADAHPLVNTAGAAIGNTATVTRTAQHAPAGTPRLMLAGSSIAALLAGPIRAAPGVKPPIVLNRAVIACAFPDGVTRRQWPGEPAGPNPFKSCGASWRHDVDTFRPDAVLFIPGGEPGTLRVEFHGDGHFVDACSAEFENEYRADLSRHLSTLTRRGTTVYVGTFAYSGLGLIPAAWYRATDCVNAIIRSVGSTTPGVKTIDFFDYMCPHGHCREKYNGAKIRPDGDHYTGPGAAVVASWLLAQMHLQ